MTFEQFLQFLNLPIAAGMVYVIFQAGYIVREVKDHGRRIGELERRAWPRQNFLPRNHHDDKET